MKISGIYDFILDGLYGCIDGIVPRETMGAVNNFLLTANHSVIISYEHIIYYFNPCVKLNLQ